jgi:hypothetical protein
MLKHLQSFKVFRHYHKSNIICRKLQNYSNMKQTTQPQVLKTCHWPNYQNYNFGLNFKVCICAEALKPTAFFSWI